MKITEELLLEFLEKMYLIRQFEYKVLELAERGMVFGSAHLCVGEEATAVGPCKNLKNEDYIIPTHRGHGQMLAKGSDTKKMMAEMIGKESGLCKGRVGSMHVADISVNNLGNSGIIGATFPISVGVGLAIKLQELDAIHLSFFGDGATNQGTFYESLNIADLWDLPVIFVCVNNLYGMGTHYCRTCNVEIYKKAVPFNITSMSADGNDVIEVYEKTGELIEMVREKRRPAFIELKTYRWLGHSAFDKHPYRTKEEIEEYKKLDPISRLKNTLLERGVTEDKIQAVSQKVEEEIKEAEKFAIESKYPEFEESMEQ